MDSLLLERKGLSQRQIVKKLGISRNTVKKYIENQGYPEEQKYQQRNSLLDPFNSNCYGLGVAWCGYECVFKIHLSRMAFSQSS